MIKKSLAYFQCMQFIKEFYDAVYSNVLTGQWKDEITSYSPLTLMNLIMGSSNRNTNYSSILYRICSCFGFVVSTRRIYATWSPRTWFICNILPVMCFQLHPPCFPAKAHPLLFFTYIFFSYLLPLLHWPSYQKLPFYSTPSYLFGYI